MKKINCFFVLAVFFVFALFFQGSRDGPERVASVFDNSALFAENSVACVQCYGGLDLEEIVMGVSPLIDTETAFAYVCLNYDDGAWFDPG